MFRLVVWWGLDQLFGLKFGWCIGQHLGGDWVSFWVVLSQSLGRWVFWWWWYFFFFVGNFGGDGLVFVAKFWWKVVVWVYWRERERERDFSKYYLMCSLYYF